MIEEIWQDMLNSLYDGSFVRWLKQLREDNDKIDNDKIKEIEDVVKPFIVSGEILKDLAKKIFEDVPEEVNKYLVEKIDAELKLKSDKIISQNKIIPQKDLILKLNNSVSIEMVWVEINVNEEKDGKPIPYDFYMGSDDADSYGDERPVHKVILTNGYWIAKYPVTKGQWEAVVGVESKNPNCLNDDNNYPKENINCDDVNMFCEKLNNLFKSQIEKISYKPDTKEIHYAFDFPSEAQWEFAARGGVKSKGYKYSGSNDVNEVAWYYENSGNEFLDDQKWELAKIFRRVEGPNGPYDFNDKLNGLQTHPVGLKKPNELGIHDMSGNVWEWCKDYCILDDEKKKVLTETYIDGKTDPCNKDGESRVIRGGSWSRIARECRSSNRDENDPKERYPNLGFRVALVPVQE